MILADIGNTHIHIFKDSKISSIPANENRLQTIKDKLYYINVNPNLTSFLEAKKDWVNIDKYISLNGEYQGLGIDRKMACYGIENGIVIDAGSAITVDKMKNGIYQGGYIIPGFNQLNIAFKNISNRLDFMFNNKIDLTKLPKNSQDSITFGVFYSIVQGINSIQDDLPIYITGGSAKTLLPYLNNVKLEDDLLFKHMRNLLKDLIIC